ncbi:hypothetical protein [Mesobacillus harenae]|uniref:hypothetical protein n=1 Tax=Mesobacillus harenae TaxID=2213203 RepID=UPI0015812050|nr:hypothetical protein [Mesobacillus harenae]
MKRSYIPVLILCAFLMMSIVFTQYMVHQYYFENYVTTLIFCGLNLLLFPAALYVYRKGVKTDA